MTHRSPLITLGAVAAAGAAVWLANGSHESAPVQSPALAPVTATVPAPPVTPRQARYRAEIRTAESPLVVDVDIDGDRARAYACDNRGIAKWLQGRTSAASLDLTDPGGSGRLIGRITPAGITGTLTVEGDSWSFYARPVRPTDD
ncbi:hypothetical protein A5757_03165 [Mycobacterium sp. 852013-51886_SCH5428379]|uniref:hypothetical protein n=1 Tax=Mycobacterium sp. 852013-51886_SCH5428379 TaxID=1834111 RepID=UPI00080032E0|nr:hypothetical protein [Mycobacterium sp. 852013-51886_SCH5428379]OBB56043.1 hypothetical protein A5757_03165 [Mycobacterium sp. 852013-51886_SCH5428379]